jgi:molybdopterin molybdotransferase
MKPVLFEAKTVSDVRELLKEHVKTIRLKTEEVDLNSAFGRVLAENIISTEDIPGFNRSTVDGFAVMAEDTFGATESLPALLTLVGEVMMGEAAKIKLLPNQTVKIPTGGMLPDNADSVVMIEYTQTLDSTTLCVEKPVAPGENVVSKGEDIERGSVLFNKGHTIRPQDLGALASIGKDKVKVVTPPLISVLSTGDEVVPPNEPLKPGQVRDINTFAISGQVLKWGAKPIAFGIIGDDFEKLYNAVKKALESSDVVLLSGGSSVGTRDHTVRVIEKLGTPGVLAHGLSVKPGKPTVIAVVEGKPVIGLPGHPVSAMVIFELIVRPIISMLLGRPENYGGLKVKARISRNISSAAGRQDFIRVCLEDREGELWAVPILGKSGLISNMIEAEGIAEISSEKQGVLQGEWVEVELF